MLKDWLVRRRENPYPSREEKKSLAIKTGLTYIQVQYIYTIIAKISFILFVSSSASFSDMQLVCQLAEETQERWKRASKKHMG